MKNQDLEMEIIIDRQHNLVVLDFARPVAWLGLSISEVEELIEALKNCILKLKT